MLTRKKEKERMFDLSIKSMIQNAIREAKEELAKEGRFVKDAYPTRHGALIHRAPDELHTVMVGRAHINLTADELEDFLTIPPKNRMKKIDMYWFGNINKPVRE